MPLFFAPVCLPANVHSHTLPIHRQDDAFGTLLLQYIHLHYVFPIGVILRNIEKNRQRIALQTFVCETSGLSLSQHRPLLCLHLLGCVSPLVLMPPLCLATLSNVFSFVFCHAVRWYRAVRCFCHVESHHVKVPSPCLSAPYRCTTATATVHMIHSCALLVELLLVASVLRTSYPPEMLQQALYQELLVSSSG